MKVGLAQINPTVGDLAGNVARCLEAIASASEADVIVLPELAIPGYPPRDILFDASFTEAIIAATDDLAHQTRNAPPVIVGTVLPANETPPQHPGLYNVAVLLEGGTVTRLAAKRLLPAYDVFFEPRWFIPGEASAPVTVADTSIGGLICEDMWDQGYRIHPPTELLAAGAELLVCVSASPYRQEVLPQRLYHARRAGCPIVYVNQVGATDELIFDGRSFALDAKGRLLAQLPAFEPAVHLVEMTASPIAPPAEHTEAELYQALVLGIRDFARKNGVRRAFLGLSGGIDSALVAILAAEALGPAHVTAVAIPSRYTDPQSTTCAQELAQRLGLGFETVNLDTLHTATESTLGEMLHHGTTGENIQARLRAMILMSYVNRYGGMLLNTSNKTELSLGYATLYGDMAGTLCPIADVTKPQVYALARWLDAERVSIPPFILERPPSAELRPDQTDPFTYDDISPTIETLVHANQSNGALRRSEHKRWQMGVILKVTEKAFGTGRMIPITRH